MSSSAGYLAERGWVILHRAVTILLPAGGEPVIEHVEDAWRMW